MVSLAVALLRVSSPQQIRVVEQNGEPWFVAADVCRALGLGWDKTNRVYAPSRLMRHLRPDEKASNQIANSGQKKILVTESGLYRLVMRSDKAEARAFQDWVTRDVLPALRKLLNQRRQFEMDSIGNSATSAGVTA